MPTKKARVNPESEPLAPHEASVETKTVDASLPNAPKVVKEVKPAACGHINRHHYGTDGKPLELVCDLDPKHKGDHHARYMKNVGDPVTDEKGRTVKITYHQEEADAYWTDAAGKPANLIREGEVEQMNLMQKDLVMQVLEKNPTLPVEKAIAQAKAMPQWNSVAELS